MDWVSRISGKQTYTPDARSITQKGSGNATLLRLWGCNAIWLYSLGFPHPLFFLKRILSTSSNSLRTNLVVFRFRFVGSSAILPEFKISEGEIPGYFDAQPMMIDYIKLEKRGPQAHPLRKTNHMPDQWSKRLSLLFDEMYFHTAFPSLLSKRLLTSPLLIALDSTWSERPFWFAQHLGTSATHGTFAIEGNGLKIPPIIRMQPRMVWCYEWWTILPCTRVSCAPGRLFSLQRNPLFQRQCSAYWPPTPNTPEGS